jgi:phenylacetyl-CoA:acceptor oxidoreductase subunit 1
MVVDLGRCVGCQTCTIACKMENGLPPGTLWRTVLDVESGSFPGVRRTFVPLTCMHCADPPCYDACPTTATRVRGDGIVWIADALCIGCGSCVVACPYEARHLVPKARFYFGAATPPELATYDPGRVGICTKCAFCAPKLDAAPAGGRPGVDREWTPACASSCIADAIVFGDLEDPESPPARRLRASGAAERMLEHLSTAPSVYYLHAKPEDERPPKRQHSWHGLAVANFFCGTTGAGLYAWAALLGWGAAQPRPLLAGWPVWPSWGALTAGLAARLDAGILAGLLAPLLVGVGLLAVGVEAGRPLRGLNVFRNLRRSWMSRESAFAMAFIVLAGLDTLLWRSPWAQGAAALAGLGVAGSQGMVLLKAKGVPAWSVPLMPAHFLASALSAGAGALLLLHAAAEPAAGPPRPLLAAALLAALAGWAVWRRYLATPPRTRTFRKAVAELTRWPVRLEVEGLGHAVPALLLGAGLGIPGLAVPALAVPCAAAAGVALVAGNLWAKHALILRAAFRVDLFDRFGARASAAPAAPAAPVARAA